ncbi:MAG: nitrate- and nitrite sensing domain-containing protein, partial [Actinomycetota bacterium]
TSRTAMGLRLRSIRQRILLLVLVPVLSLIGLYIFATSITAGQAISLSRTNSLLTATGQPTGFFFGAVGAERPLGLLYLANPTPSNLVALKAAEAKTAATAKGLIAAANSDTTKANEPDSEKAAFATLVADANSLPAFNAQVESRTISHSAAFNRYNKITNDGDEVLNQTILSVGNVEVATQSLAFVRTGRSEEMLLREDALLASDLAAASFPASDQVLFAQLTGARRQLYSTNVTDLNPTYRAIFDSDVNDASLASLSAAEDKIISSSQAVKQSRVPPAAFAAFQKDFGVVSAGMSAAGMQASAILAKKATNNGHGIYFRLLAAGGLGLLAVILSIVVSFLIGRGLVRELATLRQSAMDLAHNRLPDVMRRLRDGEEVDVEQDAPPATSTTKISEINEVGQAFSTVRQTAVEAAVGEARLRKGISDIFRNLARRSQSLLHRQLALLDAMERRAAEPEELDDLFRIDHLTTRMRRHAESLIILSGDAPARGWRNPVPLVDVLRAAVAEVEDYTRIKVTTTTGAALAGPAVGDVIHMIAELAENAAIFSPPNTPVLIGGDVVGRGFAIEIEDRGLGLSEEQRAEINDRLANPPPFDLSGSDQLGLFVASQLAKRHGVQISLRSSPYGGTTAIVLIPINLVVPEGSFEDDPASIASERMTHRTGRHVARVDEQPSSGFGGSAPASRTPYSPVPSQARYLADTSPGWSPEPEPRRSDSLTLDRDPAVNGSSGLLTQDPAPDLSANTADLGDGLPRRIRQANMVPQLRESAPTSGMTPASTPADDLAVDDRSPEEVRATMSAIQQGWQLGRSVFDVPDRGPASTLDDSGTAESGAPEYPGAESLSPGSQPGEE